MSKTDDKQPDFVTMCGPLRVEAADGEKRAKILSETGATKKDNTVFLYDMSSRPTSRLVTDEK